MKNRLPKIEAIAPVYSIISFIIYGWTFVLFFWKLPSWVDFLTPAEIFGAFSYSVLTNLIESLIVISGLLLLCILLPSRFMRDSFAAFGSVITIIVLGSAMLYQYQYRAARLDFTSGIRPWLWGTVLTILLFVFLTAKIKVIKSIILNIADRMVIFLYIIIPLSIICVLDVIARNLG
jgi:hypothetical protein